MLNQIHLGNCFDLLPKVADKSVDLILSDPPYGITQNSWDQRFNLEKLWVEYTRILKDTGVIALTSSGILSAELILSAPKLYKYSLVWKKNKPRGFLNAKKQPLRAHEDILIFYKKLGTYNPQKTTGHPPTHSYTKHTSDGSNYGATKRGISGGGSTERYPTSILEIPVETKPLHPTQKPIALGKWLIETYTNPGDLVLDNACGSGSFLIAAAQLSRNFLGMEIDPNYHKIATDRLATEGACHGGKK